MSRERRALAAFLVLAVLATVPAILLRPSSPPRSAPAARTGEDGAPRPEIVATDLSKRLRAAARDHARTAARNARVAEVLAEHRAQAGARKCDTVPLYPLALRTAQGRDESLLRALNAIPGVPLVTRMESFSLGRDMWLGGSGVPMAFRFYAQRMHLVGFAAMPASSRRVIGVRPTGPVDSPPLLYVTRTGAALLQGLRTGEVRLSLLCGPVEL
ncbi:MAG: hypothetical protein ACJ77A_19280 [Actinomycetota bacterium]